MTKFVKYSIIFIVLFITIIAGLITYLAWLQPAFYFPKPTGSYAVGTKMYHWVDTGRKEILHQDPQHPYRELMIKIWYPAQGVRLDKPITPYAPSLFAYLKKTQPLASLLSGTSRPIYTYEHPKASLASDQSHYPVILFSPGGGGMYDSNSAHCQELASYGYIVVGISHPYDSTVIQFPDGRIKTAPANAMQGKSFMERRNLHDQKIIEDRVADIRFVLDQLEAFSDSKESMFYKRLDKNNMGIFGQSLGGSSAVAVCRRDPRIKAGVDMDGSLFGTDALTVFGKPFMFLAAGESVKIFEDNNKLQKTFNVHTPQEIQMLKDRYIDGYAKIAAHKKDKYIFVVHGAGHIDFTNNALLIKLAALSFARPIIKFAFVGPLGYGSIDGLRVTEIVNAYLLAFFDKYLKEKPATLLDGKASEYAEVEMR